ncbi:hypothetical protein D1BOALGB6SA_7097, partial [Olavius sp. associated proteobacterium Delta 1]
MVCLNQELGGELGRNSGTLLTELTYYLAGFIIFDMAEVETPSCLATSAKATPCVFANPIAI